MTLTIPDIWIGACIGGAAVFLAYTGAMVALARIANRRKGGR